MGDSDSPPSSDDDASLSEKLAQAKREVKEELRRTTKADAVTAVQLSELQKLATNKSDIAHADDARKRKTKVSV